MKKMNDLSLHTDSPMTPLEAISRIRSFLRENSLPDPFQNTFLPSKDDLESLLTVEAIEKPPPVTRSLYFLLDRFYSGEMLLLQKSISEHCKAKGYEDLYTTFPTESELEAAIAKATTASAAATDAYSKLHDDFVLRFGESTIHWPLRQRFLYKEADDEFHRAMDYVHDLRKVLYFAYISV